LARCILDFSHPHFQRAIKNLRAGHPDFEEGLEKAQKKIQDDHTLCGHVVQDMPGYPECEGKIWKYDWAPPSVRSARRKAYRLVVIVPDPTVIPYQLIAGGAYQKSTTSQLGAEQLADIFRAITAPISAADIQNAAEPESCPLCHEDIAHDADVTYMASGLPAHSNCYMQRIGDE
jgi:hypothetical protein